MPFPSAALGVLSTAAAKFAQVGSSRQRQGSFAVQRGLRVEARASLCAVERPWADHQGTRQEGLGVRGAAGSLGAHVGGGGTHQGQAQGEREAESPRALEPLKVL